MNEEDLLPESKSLDQYERERAAEYLGVPVDSITEEQIKTASEELDKLDAEEDARLKERQYAAIKNANGEIYFCGDDNAEIAKAAKYMDKYGYFFDYLPWDGGDEMVYGRLLSIHLSNEEYMKCFKVYPDDNPTEDRKNPKLAHKFDYFVPEKPIKD